MPEGSSESRYINKILAVALIGLLAGSGGTGVVLKSQAPSSNARDPELTELVGQLASIVAKIKSDPMARPDPYTGSDGLRDAGKSEARDQALRAYIGDVDARLQKTIDGLLSDLKRIAESSRQHDIEAGEWKGLITANKARIDRLERKID